MWEVRDVNVTDEFTQSTTLAMCPRVYAVNWLLQAASRPKVSPNSGLCTKRNAEEMLSESFPCALTEP